MSLFWEVMGEVVQGFVGNEEK